MDNKRVLYFGDLHAPFQHQDALKFLGAVKEKYSPTRVISTGDEGDFHNMSNWGRDLLAPTATTELGKLRTTLRKVAKMFPVVECVESNHTNRLYRKAEAAGIVQELLVGRKALLGLEGYDWTWVKQVYVRHLGQRPIKVIHAAGANSFLNAQRGGISLIAGHHHTKRSINEWRTDNNDGFAAQVGCLIGVDSLAFKYAIDNTMEPLLGCLLTFDGEPRGIKMNLTNKGRWDGRVN